MFIFALSIITSCLLKPVLALASDRIIFRPTPSCSTFDNPPRYICLTFNANHQQAYYTTNWQNCNSSDPNMNNATKYYIISSWIPSFDHFVLTERVYFNLRARQMRILFLKAIVFELLDQPEEIGKKSRFTA